MPYNALSKAAESARHEYATLHLDHLYRRKVIAMVGSTATVFQEQAFEASVIGLTHGSVHTDVRSYPAENNIAYLSSTKNQFKVGCTERSLPGFIYDYLAGGRAQFGNDFPPWLPADQYAPARAGVADPGADALGSPTLVVRQVGKVRSMPLASMKDVELALAHARQHCRYRLYRRLSKG